MKQSKHLALDKETLSELTTDQLDSIAGGLAVGPLTQNCPTGSNCVPTGSTCTCSTTDNCTWYRCPTVPLYTCTCFTVG